LNNDKIEDFNFYKIFKIVVENRNIVILSVSVAVILAVLYIAFAARVYESKTSIVDLSYESNNLVSGLSDMPPLFKGLSGAVSSDSSIPYFIPDIVESRLLKEKILSLDWKIESLDSPVNLFEFWGFEDSGSLEITDSAISKLEDMIKVEVTDSGLYIITVLSEDRQLSVNIANFISTYIVEYVNNKQSDLKLKALDHTLKEIKKVEIKLEKAENRWLNFREKHPMIMDNPTLMLEEARFQREIKIEEQILIALEVERAKDENLNSKLDEVVTQLDPARPSFASIYPRSFLIIVISFILGNIIGIALISLNITRKNIYRELNNS
tara:strand:- start:565 stop:1536 length:972 start_codon:yes stop_codon:yes gene_type:complete